MDFMRAIRPDGAIHVRAVLLEIALASSSLACDRSVRVVEPARADSVSPCSSIDSCGGDWRLALNPGRHFEST